MHTRAGIASAREQPAQRPRHRRGFQPLRWRPGIVIGGLLCAARSIAWGQDAAADHDVTVGADQSTETVPDEWIDHAHDELHALVWRSAKYVDGLFGSELDE